MTTARERIAEERRQEILGAALRVFVRHGVDGATMQDIAAEVGLTAGALYRYFSSKEELLEAVFAACEAQRDELFSIALEAPGTPFERLVALGAAAWDWLEESRSREIMAMQLENVLATYREQLEVGTRVADSTRQMVELMRSHVVEAQASGELDPAVDPQAAALTLLAIHTGVQQFVVQLAGEVDTRSVFQVALRMFEALRTPAPVQLTKSAARHEPTRRGRRAG